MQRNLISIVTPVYNGEKYLQDTFDSIRAQSYTNFELIVADGGSTDGTMDIINSNSDIVTKKLSERDNGMYDAVEKGFNLATGNLLCYLNADDRFVSNALELVNIKAQEEDYDLIFGDVNYIAENGDLAYTHKSMNLPRFAVQYMKRLPFAQQSCFWTRKLHDKIGGFDHSLKYVADSKFFLTAYLDAAVKRAYVPSVLGEFRMHSTSLTIGSEEKMVKESKEMRATLPGLRDNSFLRLLFESIIKINNLEGVYKKKRYKGTKF